MNKLAFLSLLVAGACGFEQTGFAQTLQQTPAPNPSAAGSIQPNWSVTSDGSVLLSWVEPSKNDSLNLRYAIRKGAAWSEARTIATNRQFFRHPAEVPEVISLSDGTLLAHWVENGKDNSDAEYIYVSSSKDGLHWSEPAMAHKDRGPVQHGLASMIASGPKEASILWLQALQGEDGPASLMRTIVGADGKEIREENLDSDVCSCCPTSIVKTAKGLLVAYRDHTAGDIRDIAVIRFENGKWTPTKNVYPDKWKINACPTNAASAAAKDDRVAISWFTAAQDNPRVELVFSSDSGSTFTKPVVLSTGHAFGYASTVLTNDGGAIVSWIEEGGNTSRVLVRAVSPAGAAGPPLQIAAGSRASLGYPRLLHLGNDTWIAWGDSKSTVKTAQLK